MYSGQLMHEYVTNWKLCSAQLAWMDTPMDEGLLAPMSFEPLNIHSNLLYEVSLSVLLEKENLTWQDLTSELLE